MIVENFSVNVADNLVFQTEDPDKLQVFLDHLIDSIDFSGALCISKVQNSISGLDRKKSDNISVLNELDHGERFC